MIAMATEKKKPPAKKSVFVTLKARRSLAEMVKHLASLRDITIPEVLAEYEGSIQEELLKELAKRKAGLEQPRGS